MKKYNEALECYNKALEINPRYAEAWYNKGNVYSIMEKYNEASKCFMIALSLFIINQEHIELIPELLNFMIKSSVFENSFCKFNKCYCNYENEHNYHDC
jgi:tetratricopeptide (TPR) repeat protein